MLVGEPFWRRTQGEETAWGCHATSVADFASLPELIERFGDLGYDVVEMVVADQDSWDRYAAAQWLTSAAGLTRTPITNRPPRFAPSSLPNPPDTPATRVSISAGESSH